MLRTPTLFQIVFVLAIFHFVFGSIGDRLSEFGICITSNKLKCEETGYPAVLPWQLKIFGWTCLDELKYQCMHNITKQLLETGRNVYQFYGKWPFVRLFGIQEPASTIFSLGNLVAHLLGWRLFSNAISKEYILYQQAKLYFFVSINAWFWSAVFHTRDVDITEKLDYFCATLAVMTSIFFCFARIVGHPRDRKCFLFGAMLAGIYARHIYIMGFVKFDYGYNMKFNVVIGTLNFLMWLWWCFLERKSRKYVWKCAALVTTLYFCVGLELFDFPPILWTFDAHSLWHLATIPLCYLWYNFLIDDGRYEILLIKRL